MNEALTMFSQIIGTFFVFLLIIAGIAIGGLIMMIRSMRDIRVPPGADFFTTMHYVPITLVILLDILDFSLDFLSAPVSWIILDKMGMPSLRNVATIEGVIPVVTSPIPTLTLAWLLARMFNLGHPPGRYEAYPAQVVEYLDESYYDDYDRSRRRRPVNMIDADEQR